MRRASIWGVALVIAISSGCRRRDDVDAGPRVDAGRDAGTDSGTTDAGDDAGDDAGMVDGGTIDLGPILAALDYATTVAALAAGPLVSDAQALEDMGDAADNDTTIRDRVENGVAGNSIVTDGTCVSFAWTLRTATITFTNCTSEATGLTIDGVVTLSATLRPVTFAISLDALTIGGTTIDGDIAIVVGGTTGARTFTVDATLAWTNATTASSAALTDVLVTSDGTAVVLGGAFSLTTGTTAASGTLDAVSWTTGQCHPSSGSVTFTSPNVIVTFLPTTPTAGTVRVQFPPFPATEMDLLAPCAP